MFPGADADREHAAYALVGAVLVVWYLFREVDLEDAKESADEVAESASDVVDEVTEGDD